MGSTDRSIGRREGSSDRLLVNHRLKDVVHLLLHEFEEPVLLLLLRLLLRGVLRRRLSVSIALRSAVSWRT